MSKRPPVAPTQHFKQPSDDDEEEKDQVSELDADISRETPQSTAPIDPHSYIDSIEWLGGTPIYISGSEGPIILCLHGAGHSGLSFACLAKTAKSFCTIVSFDFFGHGLA